MKKLLLAVLILSTSAHADTTRKLLTGAAIAAGAGTIGYMVDKDKQPTAPAPQLPASKAHSTILCKQAYTTVGCAISNYSNENPITIPQFVARSGFKKFYRISQTIINNDIYNVIEVE